jgi:hypothetical protein
MMPVGSVLWGAAAAGLPPHLGALLFEDGFARELDAIAFYGQNFYENLIAFVKLVADVFNAMLGDFADVEQSVGAGEDFDEGPEVCQTDNFAQVRLSHFGSRR